MRIILDSDLENMPYENNNCSSIVGISKYFFDYALKALKEYPKKEFIRINVCIVREPLNGEIAFRFTPD